jgi:RNA polymerase sigma factor (sigma-70 family)
VADVEGLLRELAPQVLGALMRRYGGLDTCEDAVQEALLDAAAQWAPESGGVPSSPRGWLVTVATRRLTDMLRADSARRRREAAVFLATPPAMIVGSASLAVPAADDSLALLFMCCHPALSPSSAVALTLRAVGGLGTGEIARAFGVPEATMGQRISRAKASVRSAGARFALPAPGAERAERLRQVLQVLYLVFNEGYLASAGPSLDRVDLAAEGIRLARLLHQLAPADAEAAGLLALMLLTAARRPARVTRSGELVPLLAQDRSLWDRSLITEGASLVASALRTSRALGPYQLQAAIAAVHDEAPSVAETDWAQVLALYTLLDTVAPSPAATLGRAVAVSQVHGPAAGLDVVASVALDPALARSHRLYAVRAQLREEAGDAAGARADYRQSLRYVTNLPEKRYLQRRLASVAGLLPGRGSCAKHASWDLCEILTIHAI